MRNPLPLKAGSCGLPALATLSLLVLFTIGPGPVWAQQNPPTILSQPQSLTVVAGDNATFTVVANGTAPLSYQWRFNGAALSGAASSNHTVLNAQPGNAGNYAVVVSNSAGSVTSTNATLTVQLLDFGDAPDPRYPTRLTNNGARHIVSTNFYLGSRVDGEPDGQPDATATGDDIVDVNDDDGVNFTSPLILGQPATVEVTTTMNPNDVARLDAWIDFDGNGSWADVGEYILINEPVHQGLNTLSLTVPASARSGETFARFRLTHHGISTFFGPAPDGEVEDYRVTITGPPKCDESCEGTDFWLTFPGNYAPDPANPVQLSLCLMGSPSTTGTISVSGAGFSVNFLIPPGGVISVPLTNAAELGNANDLIQNRGIHVTASAPVGIQALNRVTKTTDGYVGLPTRVLGTEYIVQAYGNVQTGVPSLNGSQFAIVACETNTTITIVPSVITGIRDEGVPYTITLHQGETYQLRNTNDAPSDLSGTIITSDKPIAVFGSHRCANVGSSDAFFCDYLVEQLLPVRDWGMNFAAELFATRLLGDTFRFLASVDNTTVFVNGGPVATLDRGEFHEMTLATPPHITADHPIFVTQYANSSDVDRVKEADPFMVIVAPTRMFNHNHTVCTAGADFPTNYINVVAPAAARGAVQVDGVPIPFSSFSLPIGLSGYCGARMPVAVGLHTVSSPLPVGVTVYGWARYDSYGWPGCLFFGDVIPPTVTCLISNITINPTECFTQLQDLRGAIQVSDNCTRREVLIIQQDPSPGSSLGPGVHPITISAIDEFDRVGSCVITLTVVDPSPPTISCPSNVVVNCTSEAGAQVFFNVTARTVCVTNLPVQCVPPSGSFFPLGTSNATCVAINGGVSATCSFPVTVRCLNVSQPTLGTVVIAWSGGGTLEKAAVVTGPWTPLLGVSSPHTITISPTERQVFYRVKYQ